MTTNSQIAEAFYTAISTAGLGYSIAYPSKTFTPPNTGFWLALSFIPNEGIDQGLSSPTVLQQGLLQVNVCGKPNCGSIDLYDISEQVAAVLPKNTIIAGNVRVSKTPYNTDIISIDDRQILPLTIMYSE